jgi:hypothetical protein
MSVSASRFASSAGGFIMYLSIVRPHVYACDHGGLRHLYPFPRRGAALSGGCSCFGE